MVFNHSIWVAYGLADLVGQLLDDRRERSNVDDASQALRLCMGKREAEACQRLPAAGRDRH